MESLLAALSQHGYLILFAIVFMEAIGLPVPAALALLIGGGAAADGTINPWMASVGAYGVLLLADTLMFFLGRRTGWWLLGLLCRLSLNPDSCILRAADSFYRRGRMLLLFAKFVPGINTMAPPLAGSMNMPLTLFLRFDAVGVALYIGCWFSAGYLFSNALEVVTKGYHIFGKVAGWAVLAAFVVYLVFHWRMWRKSRGQQPVPRVSPDVAASACHSDTAVIYDVRSHGYFDAKAMRIQGSRRMEPTAINQPGEKLPDDKQIYLYCTCLRDATSSRVARMLLEKGVRCAVIQGGFQAWKKAGLPLEPVPNSELVLLPAFGVVK